MPSDRMKKGKGERQEHAGPRIAAERAEEKIFREAKRTRSIVSGVRKQIDRRE
jgi:hypothetical protein